MDDQDLLRYSRQIMLPEIDISGQQKLLDAKILIIGLGGLGSIASMYLASAGIGCLTLVDFDHVELSNLQRQIVHQTGSIGMSKVSSAKQNLSALNPNILINTVGHQLDAQELERYFKQSDVIIDATDNLSSRFNLNRCAIKTKKPLVSGAAIRFEGQVTVFNPNDPQSPCYHCLYREEKLSNQDSCTHNGVIAPLLGIIGSIQAIETIKILTNVGQNLQGRLLLLDALQMQWHEAILKKDPKCPVCSSSAPSQH